MKFGSLTSASLGILACFPATLLGVNCQDFSIETELLNLGTWQTSTSQLSWGQGVCLRLLAPANTLLSNIKWSVPKGAIKDYDERVWDGFGPTEEMPKGFATYEHKPVDLSSTNLKIYFVRSSPKTEVGVSFTIEGQTTHCNLTQKFSMVDAPRPVELYTSDHVAPGQTNRHKGRVIEDHFVWHTLHPVVLKLHKHPSFLHWHHLYLERYKSWLNFFGYKPLTQIKSNMPFTEDHFFTGNAPCDSWLFPGTNDWDKKIADPKDLLSLDFTVSRNHDQVHRRIDSMCSRPDFGAFIGLSSPKSELFWRFHLALDETHYVPHCIPVKNDKFGCPATGPY